MRSLAAAVLASALTDLLKGRDTAEILSWVQGRPSALPFWMACQWLANALTDLLSRGLPLTRAPTASPGGSWRTARRGGESQN